MNKFLLGSIVGVGLLSGALSAFICFRLIGQQEIPKNLPFIRQVITDFEKGTSDYMGEIYRCRYQEDTVYYIRSECCDRSNDLYDQGGNRICSPDGGFTGRGDGKCENFSKDTCEKIWEDTREE